MIDCVHKKRNRPGLAICRDGLPKLKLLPLRTIQEMDIVSAFLTDFDIFSKQTMLRTTPIHAGYIPFCHLPDAVFNILAALVRIAAGKLPVIHAMAVMFNRRAHLAAAQHHICQRMGGKCK